MIDPAKFELTVHPYALKFPPIPEKDRAALKTDIEQNGQLYPIVINRQDQILEGRTRYEICQELGFEPKTIQLVHVLGDRFDQVSEIEFIFSSNVHRRHLTDEQRVALYTEFLPELRKKAKANQVTSVRKPGREKVAKLYDSQNENHQEKASKNRGVISELGKLANVGPSKALRAIRVADNDPELLAQVSRGEKSLTEAYGEVKNKPTTRKTVQQKKSGEHITAEILPRRVDKWCEREINKLLVRINPEQHCDTLRQIAADCYIRIEKLEGEK